MEASQASEAGSIPVARSTTARLHAGRLCCASATGTPGQPRTLLPSTRALTQPCGRAPGTKLPQHAALAGRTGTKLSQLTAQRATPVQNSPSSQPSGRHRYKTPPAPPKWPISARFTPAGRTLYRSHHQQVEQGEKSHAPTPHLTHQCAPPTISHAIRLRELSTKPRNVAIPTM